MPEGPRGEKHPADVIGAKVTRIATGEDEEVMEAFKNAAAATGGRGGKAVKPRKKRGRRRRPRKSD